jgi:hypothetical protein
LRPRSLLKSLLPAVGLALCLCACSQDLVVKLEPPAASAPPATAASAKIIEIRDLRHFEAAPRDPSIPSLDPLLSDDSAISARAVGRLRNNWGAARGNVLLPEGRTVFDLVRGIATAALESEGYRVVDQASPEYAQAAPLAVDIDQFWQWRSNPSGGVQMEFKAIITMRSAPLIGTDGATATGYGRAFDTFMLTNSDRLAAFAHGIDDLAQNMSAKIRPAAAAPKISGN